ncbi:MAG: DUF937 domain-containing protein [Henriciella sp.]|nr:DUF937 domain-containing protein [Henriciella sp.]
MAGLFDLLGGAQARPATQELGAQFGLDENMTQMAMKALLPALAAGLTSNASKSGGMEALLGALKGGQHSQYLDDPSRLSQSQTRDDGNGILGHLFGSKEVSRSVATHAAQKTGIDSGLLKQMLPIVATMVMGSLSKRSQEPDVMSGLMGMLGGAPDPAPKPSGLGGLLGGLFGGGKSAPQSTSASGLGALFDADGDGSAMDDIFQMVLKARR